MKIPTHMFKVGDKVLVISDRGILHRIMEIIDIDSEYAYFMFNAEMKYRVELESLVRWNQ